MGLLNNNRKTLRKFFLQLPVTGTWIDTLEEWILTQPLTIQSGCGLTAQDAVIH